MVFLQQQNIVVLPWLSKSSHLNLIQHDWGKLNRSDHEDHKTNHSGRFLTTPTRGVLQNSTETVISCIIMWTQRCLQYRCHMVFWTHEKSTPGSIYHIVLWMKIDPGVNIPWGSKYHMTPGMSLVPTADTQGI